jgi:hypothetical protein
MGWAAHHRLLVLGLVAAVVVTLGAGALVLRGSSAEPPDSEATIPAARIPSFGHVWVIVLENRGYETIVDSKDMPFLHSLMAQGAVAQEYSAVAHPSQPNYLAMFSGSTHGVTDDGSHDIDGPSLADQLEAAGLSWRMVAENYPGDCFTGGSAKGGQDGDGTYDRKHDPAISFRAIAESPARCADIIDFTAFDPGAAAVQFIAPNLCHDMHDCSLAEGDAWLASFVPRITDSAAYKAGGLLVITFDEAEVKGQDPAHPNRVLAIALSPHVAPGTTSTVAHTHYSLLRTIQVAFGLPCLAESCEANDMAELFGSASSSPGAGPPSP